MAASCTALHATTFWFMGFFLLLGSSSSASSSLRLLADQAQDLVSAVCNKTLYVEECESSLRSDPRSETSDLIVLAEISLNQSLVHAEETLAHINILKSNTGNASSHGDRESKYVYESLVDCEEEYDEAVQNLQESVHALSSRYYSQLNSLVSTAMTDSDTCQEGFKENHLQSPLTERNQHFQKLCSNFLAITNLLS